MKGNQSRHPTSSFGLHTYATHTHVTHTHMQPPPHTHATYTYTQKNELSHSHAESTKKKNRKKVALLEVENKNTGFQEAGREARWGEVDPQVLNYSIHTEFWGAVAQ